MKEFTIISLTYNHERYIQQHLISILYQVSTYGQNWNIDYVLADDCSTDNTIPTANKWLDMNHHLFRNTHVIIHPHNIGTVQNIKTVLNTVKTDKFIIISGDDLFYKNSIFDIWHGNYNIGPLLCYTGDCFNIINSDIHKELLLCRNNNHHLQKLLKRRMQLHIETYSASSYYTKSMVDEKVLRSMNGYKYIEDYPMRWAMINNPEINIYVYEEPIYIYRAYSGISNNENHNHREDFDNDNKRIFSEISTHFKENMYLNPYQYEYHFERKFKRVFLYPFNEDIQRFEKCKKKIVDEAFSYMKMIEEKALEV